MSCKAFPDRPKWHSARPATGHMPFPGHRTVAQIWNQQESAHRRAADYGYELPEAQHAALGEDKPHHIKQNVDCLGQANTGAGKVAA